MSDAVKKQILILGAGLMQKPAILAAQELGYSAVVVDANPNAVCVPLANRFEPVDLKDKEALLALARALQAEEGGLAAVFTAGTDFSSSVSYVAERCGLAAHSFEAALNASDKSRMRACFSSHGVPSPDFTVVTAENSAALVLQAEQGLVSFPKVVKPCDNMGGRGCRLVRSAAEFAPALQAALSSSRTSRAMLEDYMEGAEFSIDAIVCNGTLTITGFADRHIFYQPYFIEMGHTMPTAIDETKRLELIATFALGIQALGLSCGVAKADIKYTRNGPMIGEIAARLSGGYMSGWTYPYASDVPLTKRALSVALGRGTEAWSDRLPLQWAPHSSVAGKPQPFALYELPCKRFCAERAWLSIPGVVRTVTGLQAAEHTCGVRDVLPRTAEGCSVTFPRNNVEKCGNCIAVGATREEAVSGAEGAVSVITLRLAPHNAATEAFLRGDAEYDENGFPPPAFPEALAAFEKAVAASPAGCAAASGELLADGVPAAQQIPAQLAPFAAGSPTAADWNHRSLLQALLCFDELCPARTRAPLSRTAFWRAFLRGSVQGALYLADCAQEAQ